MSSNLPPQAEPKTDAAGRTIWTAGTLTYTFSGLVVLFSVLMWGDFVASMKDRSVAPVFQTLLNNFGASNFLMGVIITSLGAGINMILGPIIAYMSDRHRGPRGRRIPFILWSTPFVALSMIGLGCSPAWGKQVSVWFGSGASSENNCILFSLAFFWVLFDLASIVGGAVFGGLVNDVVPRAVLGRFYGFWRAISLLCGIAFNHYLMKYAGTQYFWIYLGMALLFGFGFVFMCLNIKEGAYPDPPPAPEHGSLTFFYAAIGYFRECFTSGYYWLLFITGIFAGYATVPINSYSVPYAKALGLDQQYGDYLAITFTISLFLAYPLGWLVDKTHPLFLSFGAMALYTVCMFIGGFFSNNPQYFCYAFIAHGVLSGTFYTVNASLGFRLLPKASFAQFSAAGGIVGSVWNIFAVPYMGHLLDVAKSDYHYTFFMSGGFGVLACVLYAALTVWFMKLGGPRGYKAPDKHITA